MIFDGNLSFAAKNLSFAATLLSVEVLQAILKKTKKSVKFMKLIADIAVAQLQDMGVIHKNEVAVYRYGFDALFTALLQMASIFGLAIVVGNFIETLLFFLAFIPLRIYAGGYHARTRLKCYLLSLVNYRSFSLALLVVPGELYFVLIFCGCVFSDVIVLNHAPIVHENRKVSDVSEEHYRRVSIVISSTEIIMLLTLQVMFKENPFVFAFFLGMISETLSMLAVKNEIKE